MIDFIKSPWGAAIIGVITYLSVTLVMWPSGKVEKPKEVKNYPMLNGPSWTFENPELTELIVELRKRTKELDDREQKLNELKKRVNSEIGELSVITQKIERLREDFNQNVTLVKKAETSNLKKLADLYAGMTPDAAAKIISELDNGQIAKLLYYMDERKASAVLEGLAKMSATQAKRAALISERMRMTVVDNNG
ncbi:MAG: hypothetical protein K9N52_03250 [Verrucomicrobia bacterium]|nr:hypothetical protein [Verrucomicrobiota bacterium]